MTGLDLGEWSVIYLTLDDKRAEIVRKLRGPKLKPRSRERMERERDTLNAILEKVKELTLGART